jgi:hypothetical protein
LWAINKKRCVIYARDDSTQEHQEAAARKLCGHDMIAVPTMAIPFTQYLRPHGRKRAVEWEGSPEIEALAKHFLDVGGKYECEALQIGHASLTAAYDCDGEVTDIAIVICDNGPDILEAVPELVRRSVQWLEAKKKLSLSGP